MQVEAESGPQMQAEVSGGYHNFVMAPSARSMIMAKPTAMWRVNVVCFQEEEGDVLHIELEIVCTVMACHYSLLWKTAADT